MTTAPARSAGPSWPPSSTRSSSARSSSALNPPSTSAVRPMRHSPAAPPSSPSISHARTNSAERLARRDEPRRGLTVNPAGEFGDPACRLADRRDRAFLLHTTTRPVAPQHIDLRIREFDGRGCVRLVPGEVLQPLDAHPRAARIVAHSFDRLGRSPCFRVRWNSSTRHRLR